MHLSPGLSADRTPRLSAERDGAGVKGKRPPADDDGMEKTAPTYKACVCGRCHVLVPILRLPPGARQECPKCGSPELKPLPSGQEPPLR